MSLEADQFPLTRILIGTRVGLHWSRGALPHRPSDYGVLVEKDDTSALLEDDAGELVIRRVTDLVRVCVAECRNCDRRIAGGLPTPSWKFSGWYHLSEWEHGKPVEHPANGNRFCDPDTAWAAINAAQKVEPYDYDRVKAVSLEQRYAEPRLESDDD